MFQGELSRNAVLSGFDLESGTSSDVERHKTAFSATAESAVFVIFGDLRLDNPDTFDAGGAGSAPIDLILSDFAAYGERTFNRIDGDFAIAIWDKQCRCLTLARDAMGRRPLHVGQADGRVLFGSDAAEVARRMGSPRADSEEIASFLMQRGQTGTRSFFAGVERVPPGSLIRFESNGTVTRSTWWQPDTTPTSLDDDALLAALDKRFGESIAAISRRHPAAVAHLSAGLDSSLAVATMSRQAPPGQRVLALCISPLHDVVSDDAAIGDEYPIACQTAAMLGNVDVERVHAADDDWLSEGDRYMRAAGMPYRNQPSLGWFSASYLVASRAGATALVESTDGNSTLSWLGNGAIPTLLRQGRFGAIWRHVRDIRRDGRGSGLMTIPWGLWGLAPAWLADGLAAIRGIPDAASQAFLRRRHPAVLAVNREIRAVGRWNRMVRPIRDAADRFTFLRWSDRAAHFAAVERLYGFELCDPYSSKRLVELTSRIEEPRFLEGGFGRRFARALLRGRVPDIVSSGRIDWLQSTDWRVGAIAARKTLLADLDYADDDPELAGLFDLPALRREVMAWALDTESGESLTRGFAVIRAIGAIRFARWAAAGAPPS